MVTTLEHGICMKCNFLIQDIEAAFQSGCPKCHSRSFKFIKKEPTSSSTGPTTTKPQRDRNVSIIVEGRGNFNINLHALTKSVDPTQPIMVQDPKGVVNILLDE